MSSKVDRGAIILFSLMILVFTVLVPINVLKLDVPFSETTIGDWLVGFGTTLLAFYTWRLARTEVRERQKDRELQTINEDLKEIYTLIRNIFRNNPKEVDSVIISDNEKKKLDVIIETYSYRIPDNIFSYWDRNIRGAKPIMEKRRDTHPIFKYKIDPTFQQLIEGEYEKKRKRYKELTSSVEKVEKSDKNEEDKEEALRFVTRTMEIFIACLVGVLTARIFPIIWDIEKIQDRIIIGIFIALIILAYCTLGSAGLYFLRREIKKRRL